MDPAEHTSRHTRAVSPSPSLALLSLRIRGLPAAVHRGRRNSSRVPNRTQSQAPLLPAISDRKLLEAQAPYQASMDPPRSPVSCTPSM